MLEADSSMMTGILRGFRSPNYSSSNSADIKLGETYLMIRHVPTGATAMLRVILVPETGATVQPQVSVGAHPTAALLSDGTVWTWGSNEFGQLADGTFSDHAYPVQA